MRVDGDLRFALETLRCEINFQFNFLVCNGVPKPRPYGASWCLDDAWHRARYSVVDCAVSAARTIHLHVLAHRETMSPFNIVLFNAKGRIEVS